MAASGRWRPPAAYGPLLRRGLGGRLLPSGLARLLLAGRLLGTGLLPGRLLGAGSTALGSRATLGGDLSGAGVQERHGLFQRDLVRGEVLGQRGVELPALHVGPEPAVPHVNGLAGPVVNAQLA